MKGFLINGLSALILATSIVPTVEAQTIHVNPFNLVNLARNGYFQAQGIPSFGGLEAAVTAGKIDAEDIIEAAIKQNRLSPEHRQNRAYIQSVTRLLNTLNQE